MARRDLLPKDIFDKLPAASRAMEAEPLVVFAYLFGGLACGAPGPLSDVDIAVYLRDAAGAAEMCADIAEHLISDEGLRAPVIVT